MRIPSFDAIESLGESEQLRPYQELGNKLIFVYTEAENFRNSLETETKR